MNLKKFSALIIVAVFVLGIGGVIYKKVPTTNDQHAHKDIYYCPMHPQYTSDRPGDCPICNMKLVKKEPTEKHADMKMKDNAVDGHVPVTLNIEKQQMIGIQTISVIKKTLTKTIRAYGYVAHDLELYEAQLEYIDAWQQFYAFMSRRTVKEEFKEDWREYYLKTSERFRSSDKLKAQERLLKAEYTLKHLGFTDEQLGQLRKIKYGQPWIQPDLLFFTKDHPVWIYAQIYESDLGFIDVGQNAVVYFPAYNEKAQGVVRNVAEILDPQSRTALVRIELVGYRSELKANMTADIDFLVELNETLLIPRDAIMDTGVNKIVYVETNEGVFEPRRIETGFEGDGMVSVKSGLREGEKVVASGNFLLDSESRIHAIQEEGMTHEGAHHD